MKKICVISGTRAEYGLLRWLMKSIQENDELTLQVVATGMHLSPEFGLTYKDIENDGFRVDKKVEMLTSSDTSIGIAKSMGLGLIGFADALGDLQPDLIVVLGDRFEIFSAVSAAMVARIPVAHLHGGETTEGAFDEALRHSITKMSHLHFVATKDYQRRVIQLGENPENVFLVGGLGVENIKRLELLDKAALESSLGFKFDKKNLLITFHPATLEIGTAKKQMENLLLALDQLKDTQLIFTFPNADTEGRELINMIRNFARQQDKAHVFPSLGQLRYLSCMAYVDGVVGNSSSGLMEAPSFHKGVINIGDRQRGRIKADCIIDCEPTYDGITAALIQLYSSEFQSKIKNVTNPYGEGGASAKILDVIKSYPLKGIIKKKFYDLPRDCIVSDLK